MGALAFPASLTAAYELGPQIGAGGMGTVYRARHRGLDRLVAVKLLGVPIFDEGDARARFEDEARICAKLRHRNLVELLDFDASCDPPYMVFELVDGGSLKTAIQARRTLSVGEILLLMASILDGLAVAHAAGVVHRDLKPANILFTGEGLPKVADFGLAKLGGVSSVKTRTGIVLGTPAYMSPEQAGERELTPRSDLYSVGILLFELLAGAPPFAAASDLELLLAHMREAPPLVRDFNPAVPEKVERVVDALLAKDPEDRPRDAASVAVTLRDMASWLDRDGGGRVPVRLGRLEGRPRPTRAVRRGGRPGGAGTGAADPLRSGLRSAIVAGATAAVRVHGRGVALAVTILVAALLFLGLRRGEGGGAVLRDLEVAARGSTSLEIRWRASADAPPGAVLLRRPSAAADVRSDVTVLAEGEPGPEGLVRQSAILRGLEPGQRYVVRVEKPDGSASLPVEGVTLGPTGFAPTLAAALVSPSEAEVTVSARVPFRVTGGGDPAGAPGQWGTVWRKRLPLAGLVEAPPVTLELASIDGAVLRVEEPPERLVAAELERLRSLFAEDYDSGAFFAYWRSGGRQNEFFQTQCVALRRLGGDRLARERFVEDFWRQVTELLAARSRWYDSLAAALPSFPALSRAAVGSPRLAAAVVKALVPLTLVDGTAVWYNLEPNPAWAAVLNPEGPPWPVGFERPWIGTPDRVVEGQVAEEGRTRNAYYLVERNHPRLKVLDAWSETRRDPDAAAAHMTHRRVVFDLGDLDPKRVLQAEVELKVRSPWIQVVPVLTFAADGFEALFRERRADYDALRAGMADMESGEGRGRGGPGASGDADAGAAAGEDRHHDRYLASRSRYLTLPPSTLRPGRQTATLTLLGGPTDALAWYSFDGVRLRLRLR